jgi:plastocyanin
MKKWLALLIACLALGLVVAGCGDDDDDGGGGGGDAGATATQEDSAGGGGGGGGTEVSMQNIQFDPADVTVDAGETVTWVNDEAVPHDVEGDGPGGQFSSGPEGGMQEGDTFSHTFEEPGTYEYVCRVHAPGMAGTVTVR